MNRRDFLKLCVAAGLLGGCDVGGPRPTLGLALGGGGARGLAHIPMLQVLDELGVRPHRIAGTSIGAVIGTLYAAGMSGQAIRDLIDRLTISRDETWLSALFEQDIGRWWDFIEMQFGRGGLIDAGPFAEFILEAAGKSRFGDLAIPLKVVAADLWERQQVVFERGKLGPALQATVAIPGLFSPVHHDGRVLVDGGLVNPVPYDLLFDDCDVVVAIDVSGRRSPASTNGPGYFETVFNAMQLMQASIVREKLDCRPPDIYIRPNLDNVRVLEFNRVDEIYDQARSEADRLRRALGG